MKKVNDAVSGVGNFLGEVRSELKKCTWPTRSELWDSTLVVIVSVFLIGAFVGVCDFVITQALEFVIR